MSLSKGSKMLQFINYRVRVTIQDGRQLVGKFMAFDRHMNLVIGDCEPAKGAKKTDEEREDRRTLGFVLLRGEEVISMTVEGPPPVDANRAKMTGPGLGRAAGRGIPSAPLVQAQPGLAGPVRGIGGPALGMMQPQINRPPMNYPPPVIRPGQMPYPGQAPMPQMARGPPPQMPPQFAQRPPGPGQYQVPPPGQYGQRPMAPMPQMMRGPPPPGGGPPRPGMPGPPPPPGGQIPVFGPPRPGMPPPPNSQLQ